MLAAVTDINVLWLNFHPTAPAKGYWCFGWLEETFTTDERHTFNHRYVASDVPHGEGAIVVIPAEYNAAFVGQINSVLIDLPWCVVILASDENGLFPVEELVPPTALWVMTPHFERHTYDGFDVQFMGEYYPQDARAIIATKKALSFERTYPCSFSGQITHQRRHELAAAMDEHGFYINKTQGFTQGLGRDAYYELLANTKCTPAPSGPVTLDSFRAFEALESGGVPILDLVCPVECDGERYWNEILGVDHPLPHASNWHKDLDWVEDINDNWPLSSNLVFSWWQQHKRELRYRILDGVPGIDHGDLTIIIPTSPIPDHPSTAILDETIASVRFHHPTADILVLCDGVRPEQEHYREAYDRYVQEVCWKANFEWVNVTPIVFAGHEHQANMTRVGLDYVRTPLILFVEHDTPLVTDEPIDWPAIITLMTRDAQVPHVLRFHFEAGVHPEHEHLMIDHETIVSLGVPLRRTMQWSQRPHIADADYYRRILYDHFPQTGRTMIEDKMHSVAQCDPNDHRIAIYHPNTGNIKRSLHTDGRKSDPKFEMKYE